MRKTIVELCQTAAATCFAASVEYREAERREQQEDQKRSTAYIVSDQQVDAACHFHERYRERCREGWKSRRAIAEFSGESLQP